MAEVENMSSTSNTRERTNQSLFIFLQLTVFLAARGDGKKVAPLSLVHQCVYFGRMNTKTWTFVQRCLDKLC